MSARRATSPRPSRASTSSPAACGASAPGTASRTSARSSRTRSRRPTSWPRRPTRGDDAKLLDELGDVLFQVHFLVAAARGARRRLAGRGRRALPPEADPPPPARLRRRRGEHAGEVLRNWDAIKREEAGREPGSSARCPRTCPGRCYARKVQRRAASTGFDFDARPLRRGRGRARGAARRPRATARRVPRGGRRAVRGGQRRAQAQGRPGARAARGHRALPRPRRDRRRPRRTRGADWNDLGPTRSWATTPRRASPRTPGDASEPDRDVHARQILDSRGNPTVEVEVVLRSGAHGARRGARRAPRPASSRPRSCATAATPGWARASRRRSATSTARSPRRSRAVDVLDQAGLDRALIDLDGTPNKSRLGANAILGVSLAAARGGRGGGGPAAVALPRRRGGARSCRCR